MKEHKDRKSYMITEKDRKMPLNEDKRCYMVTEKGNKIYLNEIKVKDKQIIYDTNRKRK